MKQSTSNIIKNVLFGLLVVFTILPLIQRSTKFYEETKLAGAYASQKNVELNFQSWFSGNYQGMKSAYINEKFGFRTSLVRLYNQLRFSLFSQAHSKGIVIGKDHYLYEGGYIGAYYGLDYRGDEIIKSEINKLKAVRDTLLKLEVDLLIVFAPNKASFYPEYIPDSWDDNPKSITNFETYKRYLDVSGFDILDVKTWFENAKDTTQYPLFPKTGTHWSKYAEGLVLDSLIRKIGRIEGVSMAQVKLDSIVLSTEMRDTDNDIEKSMNLYYDIPKPMMAYPKIRFVQNDSIVKPKVLTIADSFFWGLYNSEFTTEVLGNSEFWYYFEEVYSSVNWGINKVEDMDLRKEFEYNDVIVLLSTDANLYKGLGFGFVDAAYNQFFNQSAEFNELKHQKRVLYYKELIKQNNEWYNQVKEQAESQQITLEDALYNNAIYMIKQESEK